MKTILSPMMLKKTLVSALLGVALAAPAVAQWEGDSSGPLGPINPLNPNAQTAPSPPSATTGIQAYYPLTVGNEWSMADDQGGKTIRIERKIIGVENVNGIRCAVMLSTKNGGKPFRNWIAWTSQGLTRFRTEKDGKIVDVNPPKVIIRASNQNATWTNQRGNETESCELKVGLSCERKDGTKTSAIQVIRTRKFADRTETLTSIYVEGQGPLVEIFQAGDRKLTVSLKSGKIVPPTQRPSDDGFENDTDVAIDSDEEDDDQDSDNNGPGPIGPRPNGRLDALVEAGCQAASQNDFQNAFRLFMTAARAGHAKAQMHVGICFVNGQGCRKNLVYAYVWYSLAAAGGNQQAARYRNDVAQWIGQRAVQQAEQLIRQVTREIQNNARPQAPRPTGW